jgi:hypothetical protein
MAGAFSSTLVVNCRPVQSIVYFIEILDAGLR